VLLNELEYIDRVKINTRIYDVDWAAHWFYNRTQDPPMHSYDNELTCFINDRYAIPVHISDCTQDFLSRSITLCKAIIKHKIDILIVHSSDAEAITLFTLLLKPASHIVNVVHSFPINIETIDSYLHPHKNNFKDNFQKKNYYVPITTDIQNEIIPNLESSATHFIDFIKSKKEKYVISATFGNLFKIDNTDFLETVVAFLNANPNLIHVIIGRGNYAKLNEYFISSGIGERVIYCDFQPCIKPFIELIDIYCASFPYPGCLCELECMALGKPVVSMAWDHDHHYNCGAVVVGYSDCIAGKNDFKDYCRKVSDLCKSKELRLEVGSKLLKRFNDNFAPDVRAKKIEKLYESLMSKKSIYV
jgi:predicted O-linked N-acetylglucosamine transferase (SPINDLY family)